MHNAIIAALAPVLVEAAKVAAQYFGVERKCADCDTLHALASDALKKSLEARKLELDTPASGDQRTKGKSRRKT